MPSNKIPANSGSGSGRMKQRHQAAAKALPAHAPVRVRVKLLGAHLARGQDRGLQARQVGDCLCALCSAEQRLCRALDLQLPARRLDVRRQKVASCAQAGQPARSGRRRGLALCQRALERCRAAWRPREERVQRHACAHGCRLRLQVLEQALGLVHADVSGPRVLQRGLQPACGGAKGNRWV